MHHAFHAAVVNMRIGTIEIAQGFLHPPWPGFEQKPVVPLRIELCANNSHSQFKWHVKARSCGRCAIHLNAGKIVNGIATPTDQSENAIQPSLPSRNSERDTRLQTELVETNDVGEIEASKAIVVRNIQEY